MKKFKLHKYSDGFFDISPQYGFLPIKPPLKKLPKEFNGVQNVLNNMPVWLDVEKKEHGYLGIEGKLLSIVKDIPNYVESIKKLDDIFIMQALFRAYTFIASGYLHEPNYHHFNRTGKYGKGLNILPKNIAQPLCYVADVLKQFPWQEYHYSYSLGNYVKLDSNGSFNWENLDMAASFSGTKDETGFIMLHVDINSMSPKLLESINMSFVALENKDKQSLIDGLKNNYETMIEINKKRQNMWNASNYKNYNNFRIFIMGIEGNENIFGDGVIYEGVDDKPRKYRGQTGAQDDIIPTEDIFTQLIDYYPDNILTKYLMDLRKYRPTVVQDFLNDLSDQSKNIFERIKTVGGNDALIYLLAIVSEIYSFRNGHWMFVQKYIMANTKYNVATGGTPITMWIPNQLEATLNYIKDIMDVIISTVSSLNVDNSIFREICNLHPKRIKVLKSQLVELKKDDYDSHIVYELNDLVNKIV